MTFKVKDGIAIAGSTFVDSSKNITSGTIDASTVTLTGQLRGPASFTIDPAAVGDNTGTVIIKGDLQVDGTTTTINSTTVSIDDKNIVLADGAANAAAADGAGITVTGAGATFTYTSSDDRWNLNKNLNISRVYGTATNVSNSHSAGSYLVGGSFDGSSAVSWAVDATPANTASKVVARDASGNFSASTITATLSGNASTASSWQTARTLSFTGDATGSMSVDGSGNASTALTLAASGVTSGTYNNVTVNSKGLVTSGSNVAYLTSESDTLATVTARGASTSTESIFSGNLRARKSQTAGDYTTAALWTESFNTTATGIAFHISGTVGKFLEMRTNGTLYWNGDTVWHSGNLTNLNQLTNGPGYITGESDTLATVTGRGASTTVVSSFNGGGGDGLPALRINQTSAGGSANWLGSFINSGLNAAAGKWGLILLGQAESSKNSGYLGFQWQGNSSNSNAVTLGLYAADNLLRVYGGGYTEMSGSARAPIFYDLDNTSYYLDANSTGTSLYVAGDIIQGNGGSNTGLAIYHGSGAGDYGRIRFYQAGSNNQTIHVFPTTWQGGTLASTSSGAINLTGANGVTFGSWNSVAAYIGNSGDFWTRLSIQAPVGTFTNDGSSRVLYLKGSGNIIQFQDADGTNRWENVGRNGTYYVYKGYGTGSGYKFQINDSGDITLNNGSSTTISTSKLYITLATPSGAQAVNSAASVVIDNTGNNFIQFRNSADNNSYQGLLFSDNNQGGYVVFGNAGGAGDMLRLGGYNSISFDVGTDDSTSSVALKTQRGYIDSSSNLFVYGSMRSPIFYDYNDTGYYVDPNNGTRLNSLTINDGNVQLWKDQTIDMSNTGVYSTSNYYPVTIGVPTYGCWIEIQNNLNSNVPSWATHGSGFTLNLRWWTSGSGWGTTEVKRRVEVYHERFANSTICGGITQMTNSSTEVVWLRGGGTYYFKFSRNLGATAQSTTYTINSQSVSPTSSAQNTVWNSATGAHTSYNTSVYADTRMDAPIFYDYNDTGYYVNPASTSNLNGFNFNGTLTWIGSAGSRALDISTNDGYASMRVIQNRGTSNQDGMYIGYENINSGITRIFGGGATSGEMIKYSGYTYEPGSFRAPIFYDSNDTSYYIDANSTSWTNTIKSSVFCGRDSNGYGLYKGYDNNNHFISIRGAVSGTNSSLTISGAHHTTFVEHMSPADSSTGWFFKDSYAGGNYNYATVARISASDSWFKNYLTGESSLRAPIFYDSDNTGYYFDGASTTRMNIALMNNLEAGGLGRSTINTIGGNIGSTIPAWNNSQLEIKNSDAGYVGIAFHRAGYSSVALFSTGGNLQSNNAFYAPTVYDYDDSSYYSDPNGTSRFAKIVQNQRTDACNLGTYGGMFSGDWQSLTNTEGQWNVVQVNNITSGSHSNYPSSVYTYGGVMSWRGQNHSFQLYAAHTGSLAYKTQWNNDNYSGWLYPVVYGRNEATSSVYGTIFYDSNDTSYYADPNSTSIFNYLRVAQGSYTGLFIGNGSTSRLYDDGSTRAGISITGYAYPHIDINATSSSNPTHGSVLSFTGEISGGFRRWGMGVANWNPNELSFGWFDNQTNPHYGVGISWSYPASMWIDTGHNLYTRGSMRAPIFYDYDDTAYYIDPNTTGTSLKVAGNIECTARSASWAEGIRIWVPSAGSWGGIRITRSSATGNWAIGYTGLNSTDDLTFYSGTSTAIRLNLDHSGNLVAAGNITAYGSPSDRRLKENIQPLTGALAKVKQLQGRTFNWKEDSREYQLVGLRDDIGFIADEVKEVIPEMIREGEDGYLSLRDRSFTALLVEAIKEQQSEIDELKALVKQLLAK